MSEQPRESFDLAGFTEDFTRKVETVDALVQESAQTDDASLLLMLNIYFEGLAQVVIAAIKESEEPSRIWSVVETVCGKICGHGTSEFLTFLRKKVRKMSLRQEAAGQSRESTRTQVAAALTESERETIIQEMFRDPNRTFLIVEDDPRVVPILVSDLKIRRGTQDQEIDPGVISVGSAAGALSSIDAFLKEGGPLKITVILDMAFPLEDDDMESSEAGYRVLTKITEKVKAWNEIHKDDPVTLEIIINSTSVRILEQAQALGAVSFSSGKDRAVEAVADYFKLLSYSF